jgi:hypothetical protein
MIRTGTKLLLAGALVLVISSPVLTGRAQPQRDCRTPIRYRIGTLDSRFGLTREQLRRAVEDAAGLWEGAAGRKLFLYDSKGPLGINLVYDDRQENTQRRAAIRASVSEKLKAADAVGEELRPLRDRFRNLDTAFSSEASAYKQAEQDYNQTVAQWNGKGGAPEDTYAWLDKRMRALRRQAASLETEKLALKHLADEINVLVDKHNILVRRANAEANAASEADAVFEEGRYIREGRDERIDVYQYDGETALLAVLAHELGHALGIGHNGNPASVMSPLIHMERLALTAEDVDGLKTACR